MKIIRPGIPPKEKQVTCAHCGCVFEYTDDEVDSAYINDGRDTYDYVRCPQEGCGNWVTVDDW